MKRSIYKKFEDAEDAVATVDGEAYRVNGQEYLFHYPEMMDGILNKRGRKVLRRKVRSVGMIKTRGKKMRET
jgi:hypothetical protein